jgi:parvulin-like peptidyl-prolyl isomerase
LKFTQTLANDLIVTASVLALLSACGQNVKQPGTATSTKTDTGATAGGTSTDTGKAGGSATGAADKTPAVKTEADKVSINLNDMPSDTPICSVAGTDIKVADYKRMLVIQQIQANQAIVSDPGTRARLLAEAKRRGLSLSQEEKTKLLHAAHQQKGQDPKQFQEFLKQQKATEQQFDDEVLQTGLAFKTSNTIIEEALLSDLVNRALLAQAAQEAGGQSQATNNYVAFKRTPQYKALVQQTGLPEDALKEEMINAELAKVQLSKLESQIKVSDAELKKLYEANKKDLRHAERIRLSTVLIACPENDIGPISSVRKQVMRANPKLTGKELDATVAQILEQCQQKALICLGQAKAGSDFAKLANENSDDPVTRTKKTGGDLGFMEKKAIIPGLSEAVWTLKSGQVLPQIVKSELGFNIYKVTGREAAGEYKYELVRPRLELLAKQAKLQQATAQWLDKRRKIVRVEFTQKFLTLANPNQAGKPAANESAKPATPPAANEPAKPATPPAATQAAKPVTAPATTQSAKPVTPPVKKG